MPKIIKPDSALDWLTVRELCQHAGRDLLAANPSSPKDGRVDLYREIEIDGRLIMVRLKLTVVYQRHRASDP